MGGRQDLGQIRITHGNRAVTPTAGARQPLQLRDVQRRHHHPALVVAHETALPIRYRRRFVAADTQHRETVTLALQIGGDVHGMRVAIAIGNQQNIPPGDTGLLQEITRLAESQIGAAALHRHQVGVERREQRLDSARIIGQGRHRKGIAGEHHQTGQAFFASI